MHIQITDDYVMTSDAHNFILNKVERVEKGKNAGKQRIRPVGYYPDVVALVEGTISKKMGQSTTRTMKAFIQEYTSLIDEIRKPFKVGITGVGSMPCSECGAKQRNATH